MEALAPLQEDQANVTHAVIELEAVAPLTCEEMGNLKDVWQASRFIATAKKAKPGRPVGP